jgi:hypothetical protein
MGNSERVISMFPSLTDGYIVDRENDAIRPKAQNVDIKSIHQERLGTGFTANTQDIHAVIVAAWALLVARYIGTEQVSFYIFSKTDSIWRTYICNLTTYKSLNLQEILREAHASLSKSCSELSQRPTARGQESIEEGLLALGNIMVIFKDDDSEEEARDPDEIDQIVRKVCIPLGEVQRKGEERRLQLWTRTRLIFLD